MGRPPKQPQRFYDSFLYQAESWDRPRRVVAKVEWHQGELFPRVGFLVTNLAGSPRSVVDFYNQRGTAEQWIKEGKQALCWTPDHGQIQEVLVAIPLDLELIVVVADQRGFHLLDVAKQVLFVGRSHVALWAELLVVGVGRKQVDVGQVRRIMLAQIRD